MSIQKDPPDSVLGANLDSQLDSLTPEQRAKLERVITTPLPQHTSLALAGLALSEDRATRRQARQRM